MQKCAEQNTNININIKEGNYYSFVTRVSRSKRSSDIILSISDVYRPLQKRERTGKGYGCFRVFEKTKIFK